MLYLETRGKLLEGFVKEGSSMGKQRFLGDPHNILPRNSLLER